MDETRICADIETYYKTTCPYCEGQNWVCNGNEADLTCPDIEAIECRSCEMKYWLAEPLEEGLAIDDVMCERGKSIEEL